MSYKDKKPKQIRSNVLQSLPEEVPIGEYRLYSASSRLPADVPWGGPEFQCVVVAASSFSGSEIPNLPSGMTPKGTVYLWRGFRTIPGGSPPRKVDDCLYYRNGDGVAWSLHSKDSPDHHKHIMSGSGLGNLLQDYNLPSTSAGYIANYISKGADLDFKKPFE